MLYSQHQLFYNARISNNSRSVMITIIDNCNENALNRITQTNFLVLLSVLNMQSEWCFRPKQISWKICYAKLIKGHNKKFKRLCAVLAALNTVELNWLLSFIANSNYQTL